MSDQGEVFNQQQQQEEQQNDADKVASPLSDDNYNLKKSQPIRHKGAIFINLLLRRCSDEINVRKTNRNIQFSILSRRPSANLLQYIIQTPILKKDTPVDQYCRENIYLISAPNNPSGYIPRRRLSVLGRIGYNHCLCYGGICQCPSPTWLISRLLKINKRNDQKFGALFCLFINRIFVIGVVVGSYAQKAGLCFGDRIDMLDMVEVCDDDPSTISNFMDNISTTTIKLTQNPFTCFYTLERTNTEEPWGFEIVGFFLVKVTKGSIAENNGLCIDSNIVAINGISTLSMSLDEVNEMINQKYKKLFIATMPNNTFIPLFLKIRDFFFEGNEVISDPNSVSYDIYIDSFCNSTNDFSLKEKKLLEKFKKNFEKRKKKNPYISGYFSFCLKLDEFEQFS